MKKVISIALRLVASVIMLQTLYFKFTAQPESVLLFSNLHMEPWGRIGTGIIELVASILLLLPSTIVIGAVIGIGLMMGAIVSHVLILGLEVQGDGGLLFAYAITVLICCIILSILHRAQLITYIKRLTTK